MKCQNEAISINEFYAELSDVLTNENFSPLFVVFWWNRMHLTSGNQADIFVDAWLTATGDIFFPEDKLVSVSYK